MNRIGVLRRTTPSNILAAWMLAASFSATFVQEAQAETQSDTPVDLKPPISVLQTQAPTPDPTAKDSPQDLDRRTAGFWGNRKDLQNRTFFEREQHPQNTYSKSVASPNAMQVVQPPSATGPLSKPAAAASKTSNNGTLNATVRGGNQQPNNPSPIAPNEKSSEKQPAALERIELKRPELTALISVSQRVSPLGLDATGVVPISFPGVLAAAVQHNLDIADYRTQTEIQKWTYLNSVSKFLPDVNMGYQKQYIKGLFFFPFTPTSASTATAAESTAAASASSSSASKFLKISTPFTVLSSGFTYHAYQGGKVTFAVLENKNRLRAARAAQHATLSDTLLQVAKDYYSLLLNEAYLQIQIRAVETDEEQLRVNTDLEKAGLATNLDVLQSRTQLSRDRVSLIDQQKSRRVAAIKLADTLNMNMAADLEPTEHELYKVRLVDENIGIGKLLEVAIDNRPELKQYEELRRAAKKAIVVAAAPLSPKVNVAGNIYGLGPALNSVEAVYQLSCAVNFSFAGLGTTDYSNVQIAKWKARQALVQTNKEFNTVIDQARTAFIDSLTTERKIDETVNEVISAEEELRLAKIRFENGLGTNLDIITAQRDRTTAYLDRALAIANYNIAEVQLLHDMGTISVQGLSAGRPIATTEQAKTY